MGGRPLERCRCCGLELGSGAYSNRHARAFGRSTFHVDLLWCINCGRLSPRERPRLYHRLRAWRFGIFNALLPLRSIGSLTMDEWFSRRVGTPGLVELHHELIWHIRACLLLNVDGDPERPRPAHDEAAWALARTKLTGPHLVEYARLAAPSAGVTSAIQWMRTVEEHHVHDLDAHTRAYIRSYRIEFEKQRAGHDRSG